MTARPATAARTALRHEWDVVSYWAQWLALELWGPAQQDRETDPIERLKRRYGRRRSW